MEIAAIILAAGQGTRLKSALPKPLHRIGGRPMLAWSLDAAIAANAGRIITVLPRQSEQIQDWLDGREFCIQDKPLGTGHAVLAAAPDLADFNGVQQRVAQGRNLMPPFALSLTAEDIRDVAGFVFEDLQNR